MQAFDARRVDEDLAIGFRLGQRIDAAAIELDGERRPPPAVAVALVGVGAQRRVDEVEDAADDAILIERLCGLERGGDGLARLGGSAFAIAGETD